MDELYCGADIPGSEDSEGSMKIPLRGGPADGMFYDIADTPDRTVIQFAMPRPEGYLEVGYAVERVNGTPVSRQFLAPGTWGGRSS
jgi:hypothetical protein